MATAKTKGYPDAIVTIVSLAAESEAQLQDAPSKAKTPARTEDPYLR